MVVLNSFSFCLSVKILIFPSNLNESLAGSIPGCGFFPFITLNMLPFWPAEFLMKSQPIALWEFPSMLFVVFPWLLLILSLSLIFDILITAYFSIFLFGLILYGTLCASWTWMSVSFPRLGKFSVIMSQICSQSLSVSLLLVGPL